MKLCYPLILLLLLTCSGCIREYIDACAPGYNLTLAFRLPDENQTDVFPQYVNTVDLFLYDEEGRFVSRHTVTQDSLTRFQGIHLNLVPGTYRLIGWGNLSALTTIDIGRQTLCHTNAMAGRSSDGDRMEYAPQVTLTIPATGTTKQTIDFQCAHHTLEVFVKGFTDTPPTRLPLVEVTPLAEGYDFGMHLLSDHTLCYEQRAVEVTTPSGPVAATRFHTPCFEADDPIRIHIKKPSDDLTVYTVDLPEFLARNNIALSNNYPDTIRVMIEFMDASIRVSTPHWDGNDVEPQF